MRRFIMASLTLFSVSTPMISGAVDFVGGDAAPQSESNPAYLPKFQSAGELARYDALINGGTRADMIESLNIAAADCGGMTEMKRRAENGDPKSLYYLAGMALYGAGDYTGAPPEVGISMLQAAAKAAPQESEKLTDSKIPERVMAKYVLYMIDRLPMVEGDPLESASRSVNLSDDEARKYLVAAADAGIPHAQHQLGKVIREEKLGFKKNLPVSLIYTSRAAKSKYQPAMTDMTAITDAYVSVRKLAYVRKGVVQGDMKAIEEMIRMYEEGDGVPRNLEHAQELRASLELLSESR